MESKEIIERVLSEVKSFSLSDMPNIDLYMDQVTTYLNDKFDFVKRHEDDKLLTKTMINNYTKSRLLPPPEKKKYSKDHLMILSMIFFFKNVISVNDLTSILTPLIDKHFHNEDVPLSLFVEDMIGYIQNSDISENIIMDLSSSSAIYDNIDEDEKEYTQILGLITMLSYEIFVRKIIIEKLIDTLPSEQTDSEDESSK